MDTLKITGILSYLISLNEIEKFPKQLENICKKINKDFKTILGERGIRGSKFFTNTIFDAIKENLEKNNQLIIENNSIQPINIS